MYEKLLCTMRYQFLKKKVQLRLCVNVRMEKFTFGIIIGFYKRQRSRNR